MHRRLTCAVARRRGWAGRNQKEGVGEKRAATRPAKQRRCSYHRRHVGSPLHPASSHRSLTTYRNFPDSMTVTWHPRLISNLLTSTFAPKMASVSSKEAPQANIDVIITFDAHGISSHPNHMSLYAGAHAFLKALMHRHSGWECPIKLYTLRTTNILRKYISLLDAPATVVAAMTARKELGGFPTPLMFVSSPLGYRAAQRAMTTAHESQMRWFRWGWISLSRYMVINDLKKEKSL
jgi:N-acetylglucosaminylphosphatidylinositol deacetylase